MQNTNRAQESGYKASLTREQFLFHEMRIVAKQMVQGEDLASMIQIIAANNLFQYPTERMTAGMVRACYRRLNLLNSEQLLRNIAEHSVEEAKQICLYAIMKDNRLVWDFMVTVIGEKYRNQDFSYGKLDTTNTDAYSGSGKLDMTSFFIRLQEQNDAIADWSESTVKKLKSVLNRILRENDYLDSIKAGHLNPVWLYPELENVILTNGDQAVLPAFNRFE